MIKIFSMLTALFLSASCMTTRVGINNYNASQGKTETFDKAKQFYLFWGLVPIGRPDIKTPNGQPCQVQTKMSFIDGLLFTVTGGVVCMQSIKVESYQISNN